MRAAVLWILLTLASCAEGTDDVTIAGANLTTDEDTPVTFALDIEGDPGGVPAAGATKPAHGRVTVERLLVTYTPAKDYVGPDSFDVYIADNKPPFSYARIDVMVHPIDDAPVATNDRFAATEDVAFAKPFDVFLANDVEVDEDALSIVNVGAATNGSVSITAPDTISFVPAADFVGAATFQYTMSDGTTSSTATVTLNVGGTNDAPVAVDDVVTTAEDTMIYVMPSALLANDSDLEGQTLTISSFGVASHCVPLAWGGSIRVQIDDDYTGVASFEYTATDGTATDVGVVSITVTPVADAPRTLGDSATGVEDQPLSIPVATLLANDVDPDGDDIAVAAVTAHHGTATLDGDVITYTPPLNFVGETSFQYTVSDGSLTATNAVTVHVSQVNDAPVAGDDVASTSEDRPVDISKSALMSNDVDVDYNMLTMTSITAVTGGTVSVDAYDLSFYPAANFNGVATVEYTISDGTATDTATVAITVTPVDDAPVLGWDQATATEDTPLQIPVEQLLANDIDVEGSPLTVTGVTMRGAGSVSLSNGIVAFTPAPNDDYRTTIEYTVSDGTLESSQYVHVTITPVNDAPTAKDDAHVTTVDVPLQITGGSLANNDEDIDNAWALRVTSVASSVHGTVSIMNPGTTSAVVTFTPEPGFVGTGSFEYTVSDGEFVATATVYVVVTAN